MHFRYYQPHQPYLSTSKLLFSGGPQTDHELVSSMDLALSAFALLAANLLSCKRCIISLIDQEFIYIIAESTRSLSITSPHTYDPGDELWLGGSSAVARNGTLCERTVSLLAPNEIINGEGTFLVEVLDLKKEPPYQDLGYVTSWPNIRYYAGVPLRTKNGFSIGSLCVTDDQPRPGGLNESEKLTLVKMAETVMGHLERVRAERDVKRGRDMELGISRFLAGNFRLGGAELDNELIGDGSLGEEEDEEEEEEEDEETQVKRNIESARSIWVDQLLRKEQKLNMEGVKQSGGGLKVTKLMDQSRRQNELDPFARDFGTGLHRRPATPGDSCVGTNMGLGIKSSQLPLSFPSPQSESLSPEICSETPLYLASPVCIPELSRRYSCTSINSTRTAARAFGSAASSSSLSNTVPPSSPSDSLFQDAGFSAHFSAATTPTGQLQPIIPDVSSAFRSTFAHASFLIRKSIQVDGVVFVDADLGETYDDDDCMEESEDTLPQPQSFPQRPKKHRRRSGILGFATAAGSSYMNPFGSNSVMSRRGSEVERTLGFDVGEIDEPFLHQVAGKWPQGRIFACSLFGSDSNVGTSVVDCSAPSTSREQGMMRDTLVRFLPGSKSTVAMPLYDFAGKLFAVGFAWSCSSTRVFCEDVEKSYMAAFGNSIMAEIGRLHCVSGKFEVLRCLEGRFFVFFFFADEFCGTADKAKGDFISSVSHELRSPLHGILASAEFLADTNLDSFQRSFVDTVESCGRTLLDTINHVLDFSKLNSFGNKWAGTRSSSKKESVVRRMSRQRARSRSVGSLGRTGPGSDEEELERKASASLSGAVNDVVHLTAEIDLSAILEEVTEGVFAGYEFKGISTPGIMEVVGTPKLEADGRPVVGAKNDIMVIIDIDRNENGWVFETQPGALRRIFLNLGGNAIKYTDSGWVKIRMKVEDLPPNGDEEEDRKSLVTLIFTDSGKGISREFLKTRLFTPFSQENPLVSGTGLGMSIVKQIVEMLGGEIDVKSRLGKGTEVTVSLVLKRGAKASQTLNKEINEKDAEFQEIEKRTRGKKVCLCGFECENPESEGQVQAVAHMRDSFERYLTEWFGMEVVPSSKTNGAGDGVDIFIVPEGSRVNAHLACCGGETGQLAGKIGGPPLIVICSNAARHEIYQPLNKVQDRGIVDLVSKPCGPRKLAKALAFCLDQIEAQSKAAAAAAARPTILTGVDVRNPPPAGTAIVRLSESLPGETPADANIPTTMVIPATPDRSTVPDTNSISLWKQEVERISSLNAHEPDKRLPSTLIVEDNPVNLMLLATFLKKKGYPFEKATNGLEAFKAVERKSEAFDIILMGMFPFYYYYLFLFYSINFLFYFILFYFYCWETNNNDKKKQICKCQ